MNAKDRRTPSEVRPTTDRMADAWGRCEPGESAPGGRAESGVESRKASMQNSIRCEARGGEVASSTRNTCRVRAERRASHRRRRSEATRRAARTSLRKERRARLRTESARRRCRGRIRMSEPRSPHPRRTRRSRSPEPRSEREIPRHPRLRARYAETSSSPTPPPDFSRNEQSPPPPNRRRSNPARTRGRSPAGREAGRREGSGTRERTCRVVFRGGGMPEGAARLKLATGAVACQPSEIRARPGGRRFEIHRPIREARVARGRASVAGTSG